MISIQAVVACIAGDMVGYKYPVSLFISFNTFSDFNNLTGNFMSEDKGSFLDAIPLHYITAADSAGNDLYKKFSVTYLWNGSFFKPNIFIIIVNRNSHRNLLFKNCKPLRSQRKEG